MYICFEQMVRMLNMIRLVPVFCKATREINFLNGSQIIPLREQLKIFALS